MTEFIEQPFQDVESRCENIPQGIDDDNRLVLNLGFGFAKAADVKDPDAQKSDEGENIGQIKQVGGGAARFCIEDAVGV